MKVGIIASYGLWFSFWFLVKKDPQETVSLTFYSGLYSMFRSQKSDLSFCYKLLMIYVSFSVEGLKIFILL